MSEFTLDIHDIRVSGSKIVPGPVLKLADVSTPLSPLPGSDCSPPQLSSRASAGPVTSPLHSFRRGEKSCYGGGMPIKIPVDFDVRDDYRHQRRREDLLQFFLWYLFNSQAYVIIVTNNIIACLQVWDHFIIIITSPLALTTSLYHWL